MSFGRLRQTDIRSRLAWGHAKVGRKRASAGRVSGTHKCATAPVCDPSPRIQGVVRNKHSLGATGALQGDKLLPSRTQNGESLKRADVPRVWPRAVSQAPLDRTSASAGWQLGGCTAAFPSNTFEMLGFRHEHVPLGTTRGSSDRSSSCRKPGRG